MKKLLIVLVMAGLITCTGCASLDALLGNTNDIHAKLGVLEQEIDAVLVDAKNLQDMNEEQRAEFIQKAMDAKTKTEEVHTELQEMGKYGLIAAIGYAVVRHGLPRLGPVGSLLSLVLSSFGTALARKKEDGTV